MTAKEHLLRKSLADANLEAWVDSIKADGMREAAEMSKPPDDQYHGWQAYHDVLEFANKLSPPPPPTEAAGAWPRG